MSLFEVISEDEFNEAANEPEPASGPYPIPEQFGPLRHWDATLRCASRGCASPTHYKLQGIPYCYIHCLRKMNDMLIEFGINE